MIVDVVGPGAETLLERVELWAVNTVGRNLCQADVACSTQTGVVCKLLTVCLCGCCLGRLV